MLFSLFRGVRAEEPERILPPRLEKGDLIVFHVPGYVPEEDVATIEGAMASLRAKGYQVKLASNFFARAGMYAGEDSTRAGALMESWKDPRVKAIWCYRGGYGSEYLLDKLDYEVIRKNPKVFIGMSDATALHAAIQKETGLVTFLGPNFNIFTWYGLSGNYTEREMWQMVDPKWNPPYCYKMPEEWDQEMEVLVPGKAKGALVGGNLTLLAALTGTPWQVETKGKILVIEDLIYDSIADIDWDLRRLKKAGMFKAPAAVVLGTWRDMRSGRARHEKLTLMEVFRSHFIGAHFPVVVGFPTGHFSEQVTLPLGIQAQLNTTRKELRLLESPVESSLRLEGGEDLVSGLGD